MIREKTIWEQEQELEAAKKFAHEDSPYVRRIEGQIAHQKCNNFKLAAYNLRCAIEG